MQDNASDLFLPSFPPSLVPPDSSTDLLSPNFLDTLPFTSLPNHNTALPVKSKRAI